MPIDNVCRFCHATVGQPRRLPSVLPFFEEQGVKVETVLSDNQREFCGCGVEGGGRITSSRKGSGSPEAGGIR